MDTLDQILENLWSSAYVQANPNKSYKNAYNAEYLAIGAYMAGGNRPDPATYSKMGKVLVGLEDHIRGEPEPVPTLTKGIGTLRFGSTLPPPNPSKYDLLVCSWDKASVFGALATRSLHYMSQVSCIDGTWHAGVTATWARANGMVLQKQGGGELMNVSYGRPLGDMGHPTYQQEWIKNVKARLLATGLDGVFIDDTQFWPTVMTGGAIPAKYPTQGQWMTAVVSFAKAISDAMRPQFYVTYNATGYHDPVSEGVFAGDPDLQLFTNLAPYADGLMCEYWQSRDNIPGYIRHSGNGWTNHWDEWQRLPQLCASKNVNFLGNVVVANAAVRDYVHTSLLLEDGGTFMWGTGPYDTSGDPWNASYDKVRALGKPVAAKVKNGNRWQRQFEHGLVWVDPVAGTYG